MSQWNGQSRMHEGYRHRDGNWLRTTMTLESGYEHWQDFVEPESASD
jgi:hypothetical protein